MKRNLQRLLLSVFALLAVGSVWAEEHFLVGGATACGWTTGAWERSPVAMTKVDNNTWVWCGKLTTGDGDNGRFKIPNSAGGWDGYWATEQGTVLGSEEKDLSTDSGGDKKFCVAEAGIYKVTINTSTLKIKAEKLAEPAKDGGYYLLGSVNDYYWYAGAVTSGENTLKARLTADLDFQAGGFFPLACDRFKFKGEFDGGGHTMTNLVIKGDNQNVGFFRYASDGAVVHDFVIGTGSSFEGLAKVAGLIGFARDGGTIHLANIVNLANVRATGTSDANAAGLVGCAIDGTKIIAANCGNIGDVAGQNGQCAAFAGWTQGGTTFTNCWNMGEISNIDGSYNLYRNPGSVTATNCYDVSGMGGYSQGEQLPIGTAETGELTYRLNNKQVENPVWYQTLTPGTYPLPFGTDIVYAIGHLDCAGNIIDGTVTYSNTNSGGNRADHTYVDYRCSVCGHFLDMLQPNASGAYEIATADQLDWFAQLVNQVNTRVNGVLTADIDFSSKTSMIGSENHDVRPYEGTFDGQGHSVTVGYTLNVHNVALFRSLNNAKIRNLITRGTIQNENNSCSAGIFAGAKGDNTLVENCVSYITFNRTAGGDATIGGISAYMWNSGTIRNCAFLGSINTPSADGNGGIMGYANQGESVNIINCLVNVAAYNVSGNSVAFARNKGNFPGCYYVNKGGDNVSAQATSATAEQLVSGELCYLLNNSAQGGTPWNQIIGTDATPLPLAKEGAKVYKNGVVNCDGTDAPGVSYANEEGEATVLPHVFNDGMVCTVCGEVNPDYEMTATDGVYEIATADELRWFAQKVNSGSTSAKALLTADIDMSGKAWTPIGNNDNRYKGVFDGQYHTIDNLVYEGGSKIGIFGVVTGDVVIKNLIAGKGNRIKGTSTVGGIIGCADGSGKVTLENVGHHGYVEGTGNNCCAIFGVIMDHTVETRVINCFNTGDVKAGGESAIITGWFGNFDQKEKMVVRNFWNTGKMLSGQGENGRSLWRNNLDITAENVFSIVPDQGAKEIDETTANNTYPGRLAFVVNGMQNAGFWRQNIDKGTPDEWPTFDPSHELVYMESSANCAGHVKDNASFTNEEKTDAGRDEHHFANGFCVEQDNEDICDAVDPNFLQPNSNGIYEIGKDLELKWFAKFVNAGHPTASAILTADINMDAYEDFPGIGNSQYPFKGTFDGQSHVIDYLRINYDSSIQETNPGMVLWKRIKNPELTNIGLFGVAAGGAIIKNFTLESMCSVVGKAFVGGIIGTAKDGGTIMIERVGTKATVTATNQNAAAFVGVSDLGQTAINMRDCYNQGDVRGGNESAIICGWFGNGSTVTNFYNMGKVITGLDGQQLLYRNKATLENVYVLDDVQLPDNTQGTKIQDLQTLYSGELCFVLNGKQSNTPSFYQTISEDTYPTLLPSHKTVYLAGNTRCDGTAKDEGEYTYANSIDEGRDPHQFEDGVCVVCHAADAAWGADLLADGAYNLSNAKELRWFASFVGDGNPTVNARLTSDINFEGIDDFYGIGTDRSRFQGEIDGQKHIITGWVVDDRDARIGLVRYGNAGLTIRNLTIDNTCSIVAGEYSGAFIADLNGVGPVTLECLGNEAYVAVSGANAGGIIGCNFSGEAKIKMTNCYNTGDITSGWEGGGIAGWLGNDAVTINCYNMGFVVNGESFARGNNIQLTNCFDPVTKWPALQPSPYEDFTNGTIFKLLSEAAPGVWFESPADGHPILYDPTTSGIAAPTSGAELLGSEEYFNLSGQRVAKPGRGLYIKNGKKVVVK